MKVSPHLTSLSKVQMKNSKLRKAQWSAQDAQPILRGSRIGTNILNSCNLNFAQNETASLFPKVESDRLPSVLQTCTR